MTFISPAFYLRVPEHEKLPWQKTSLQMLCALLAGYLKDWETAFDQSAKYVADMETVLTNRPDSRRYWIRAVIARDWFGLRARKISPKEARARLELACGPSVVSQILNILTESKAPSSLLQDWFPGLKLPRCWDCRHCSMQKDCRYGELEKLHLRLKNAAANRPIDQMGIGRIIA